MRFYSSIHLYKKVLPTISFMKKCQPFIFLFNIIVNLNFICRKDRPPLKFSFLMQFFLHGLIGYAFFFLKTQYIHVKSGSILCFHIFLVLLFLGRITLNQILYLLGMEKTSPTFASAMDNSIPAVTFLMATIFRQII